MVARLEELVSMSFPFFATLDSVVMLTWSDWHTEPRSNRYHYATRFARHVPVYFVQPDGEGDKVTFECVDGHDITLVHIAPDYGPLQSARLAKALRKRGVSRPLVWIYNVLFAGTVMRLHPAISVYHATEDYVAPADSVRITRSDLSGAVRTVMELADLVVAVSEGVADSHRAIAPPDKPIIVLANGCDFPFWRATGAAIYRMPDDGRNIALFQGGINGRLDYALLDRLTELLPAWEFWFCGKSTDGGDDWSRLKRRPNVKDHGLLSSEGIADLARQARVGLIPFKQSGLMRRSLPLKAYEYLACGLPVVSIPIDALSREDGLFAFGETAEAFAAAILRLAPSRSEPDAVAQRLAAAAATSYDARFDDLTARLETVLAKQSKLRPALNVLMLYDDRSTHVGTIREHLEAFRAYSRHRFHFMPATGYLDMADGHGTELDLSYYDAIAIHYSVRVSINAHLSSGIAAAVRAYRGPKLLFIQDEYDRVETARSWIERLGIDSVFTNVPVASIDIVYPRSRFPTVTFIPTLTGYVPEDPLIDEFARPMPERDLRIAYRGRALPHQYGALGQEKYRIGIDVRHLAERRGIPVDIEVDDSKRIYGLDWYRFIGSARATLGTESGANVFDMDGGLAELAAAHKDMPFAEFAQTYLSEHEGLVQMNQISPKIFEAIRLRTALILFEGRYSGIISPGDHFITLKKDYSNIGDIFDKLEDIPFLEALTERAYRDVIAAGGYSYRRFVESVDSHLSARVGGRRRATIASVPLAAIYGPGNVEPLWAARPEAALLSDTILGPGLTREDMIATARNALIAGGLSPKALSMRLSSLAKNTAGAALKTLWRVLPQAAQNAVLRELRGVSSGKPAATGPLSLIVRPVWHLLPRSLRTRITARIS
jgi:glycosyltransferase involved in cell wall biosynthesis